MASTSISASQKSFKYDVFLSFRGEDTRKNFVDHLYYALQQKSIHTYKDDERIEKGKRIGDELVRSIEDSKLYIIVFSKNYASSSWCLEELVKIMDCQKTTERTAYPIFYDVEPSEIRKQSGVVGQAFAKHEKDKSVEKWRDALKEAADLAGWELKNTVNGHEAKFIRKIVEEISLGLRFANSSIDGKLIGMETRVRDVTSSLETAIDDVRIIGIKGIGGAGKTTLARAVFDQISIRFEGSSFVENIREVSKGSLYGLKLLQKQLLSDVSNDPHIIISSVYDGKKMIKKMMCGRKVLVVLDDVDHIEQLEALAGEPNWFKPGSRIIITTRDEQVLRSNGVNLTCDVNLLSYEEAICLFSKYAFGKEIPVQGYEELSSQVVSYVAGLPLTIKVLGSFLCGKNEPEWKDALERLKTIPLKETLEKLELSYAGLEEDYKEMFLDVACILKGERKDDAIRMLESCGFHARTGIRVLEQKSLVTISENGRLGMHDHIEEMGKNIVRRVHPDEPERHSRLWIDKEIIDILANGLGTKQTRCIKFSKELIEGNLETVMRGLMIMKKLRTLSMCSDWYWTAGRVSHQLPKTLRYLSWLRYPYRSLLETFQADNLVGLELRYSRIKQLWSWGERKVLNKLRFLDISNSDLITFDLGLTPNLETLCLAQCTDFEELHIPTKCLKLTSLNLSHTNLKTLDLGQTPNLVTLILIECAAFVELYIPVGCLKLISFNLSHSKLRTIDLERTPNLESLSVQCCELAQVDMVLRCPKLKSLILYNSKLKSLDLGLTPHLETLNLENCDLIELHMPFGCLNLRTLSFNSSQLRKLNRGPTTDLVTLSLEGCCNLVELDMPFRCPQLKSLSLSNSKLRALALGITPHLETLSLAGCHEFVELHMPFGCPNLRSLDLCQSKLRTLDLELTPNLERLKLEECYDLVEIHAPVGCLEKLVSIDVSGCGKLASFLFDKRLQSLEVGSLSELYLITKPVDIFPLLRNSDFPKFRFTCYYKENPDSSYGNLEKLLSVGLCDYTDLKSFAESICGLRYLRKLELEQCIPEATKDLGKLECLEDLTLSFTTIKHLPDNFCTLKKLKSLKLESCWLLKKLPEDFSQLESLEELLLLSTGTKHLPDSFCMLKHLKSMKIKSCLHFDKLPKEFGRLKSLEELLLSSSKINHLPASFCMLKNLRSLKLKSCQHLDKLPENLRELECLKELSLSSCEIKHLPDGICMWKHLKSLKLKSCWLLDKLPEDLGRIGGLKKLIIRDCIFLRNIPNSICNMQCLRFFHLTYCILVDKLPEELGSLECLKELNIEGTGITHLPQSIFGLEGLCIVGSKWQLESYGLIPLIQTSKYSTSCFI